MKDVDFNTNEGHTSLLGIMVVVVDKWGHCNILHYSLTKSRCVTRSVLVAEVFVVA